ncbi:GNAT family N-acetyltransferase [Luteolibacter luteus]|uniref:GNAT family N-acetyltransferase n=1 Tax=Luteolibacter luteus TaxID=2728835 RepID=A0A858REN0_9BACT|nr:GNAT family N-acetyltransferase [Luteolibacter luteus]QJE94859.1 GNAT family N-acetyltransferase [Luteolibacter luteus]
MNPGPDFDLQPTLEGELITLRPLLASDFEALHAVASDPLIWEQHPEPTRYQREVFERWFHHAMESRGTLVVYDNKTSEMIGSSRYYDWDPAKKEIAIGFTFLSRSYWGGEYNREMKRLMLDHAYQWADRVWLHIGKDNQRSRRAAEKIGAVYSHADTKELAGTIQHYVFYYLTKGA